MSERIAVPMDAGRVCDAIAKIGYRPATAIMDIVDNSVTAGAKNVSIRVDIRPEFTLPQKNNVVGYVVVDDGCGIDDAGILNALKLGSKGDYAANSLSKFGMGLKSAAFSLGSRVTVVSKRAGVWSSVFYADKNEMTGGDYVLIKDVLDVASPIRHLVTGASGTVVEISGCESINQDSAKRTLDRLSEHLGVTYNYFIAHKGLTLKICVRKAGDGDGAPIIEKQIEPLDILFLSESTAGFSEETYDGIKPARVYTDNFSPTAEEGGEPIKIDVVVFPKADMAQSPYISDLDREKIKSYKVSRANKGFFIYRNNRLISWANDLEGIIGRDEINLRGRILLTTAHDDILHVDVSKQRLDVPEEILDRIARVLETPIRYAKQARLGCEALTKKAEAEGAVFNQRNQELAEQDPDATAPPPANPEVRRRTKTLQDTTEKRLSEAGEKNESPPQVDDATGLPVFEKVRYSEKVTSINAWEAELDPDNGTFVRINKNHALYETVLSKLTADDPNRQALEGLIWCLAAAENLTVQKSISVPAETVRSVLDQFKKRCGFNLDSWCSQNHDLYSS